MVQVISMTVDNQRSTWNIFHLALVKVANDCTGYVVPPHNILNVTTTFVTVPVYRKPILRANMGCVAMDAKIVRLFVPAERFVLEYASNFGAPPKGITPKGILNMYYDISPKFGYFTKL